MTIDKKTTEELISNLDNTNPIFFQDRIDEAFALMSPFVKDSKDIKDRLIKEVLNPVSHHMLEGAIKALSSVINEEKVRDIILEKTDDDDICIRATAVEVLTSSISNDKICEALLERLNDDFCYSDVRIEIVKGLFDLSSNEKVRDALVGRLDDDDFFVREKAILALSSEIDNEKVSKAVVNRLNDEYPEIRNIAEKVLGSSLNNSNKKNIGFVYQI